MGIVNWTNKNAAKLRWRDIQAIKISVFAFALMVAKLYEPILQLDWQWYLLIAVIFAIFPVRKALVK